MLGSHRLADSHAAYSGGMLDSFIYFVIGMIVSAIKLDA